MKKLVFLLLTLGVVMFFTSSRTTISSDSRVGTKAPDLSIANETSVVELDNYKGKFVVMNMWTSADAITRIENIELNKLARDNDKLVHLAVNFDRSKALFMEVLALDSLDVSSQYFCEHQDRPSFQKRWGSIDHPCTFLINGDGVIVAVNPTIDEINKAVK
jgi:peroxiredoxin